MNGLTAPARTPQAVIDKINADVRKVIRSPELMEKLKVEGSDPVGSSVEEYAHFLRDEIAKWGKVIKFAHITGLEHDPLALPRVACHDALHCRFPDSRLSPGVSRQTHTHGGGLSCRRTTDIVSRTIAPRMSEPLGQQILVDNRGGAGGVIATEQVAKAAPDGYTLLMERSAASPSR